MAAKKSTTTQADAEAAALVAGTLPEEDRRAPEPIPEAVVIDGVVVDVPPAEDGLLALVPDALPVVNVNDQISHVRERADGVRVNATGQIVTPS